MKQKTDLHQSLSALTTAEFDANPPTAIRPLTPPVECAECERLWAENEALTKDLSGSAVRNINLMIKLRDMADLQAKNEALREIAQEASNIIDLRYSLTMPPEFAKALEDLYIAYASAREIGATE